jgi:hypothetical protein
VSQRTPTVAKKRRAGKRKAAGKAHRRLRRLKFWPDARLRRAIASGFRAAPFVLQALSVLLVTALLWLGVNWVYQVIRKPSELLFPVSGTLNKTPAETWRQYAPLFEKYSTHAVTAELLAALAQVEGSGNPIIRTYWRWSFRPKPFEVYRPASSSVGMYQITDGTFAEAKRLCIKDHAVIDDGPWNDWNSCWFNGLYTRVLPSHAVELTSAYLDRSVATILARNRARAVPLERKQELAAIVHLCGAGAGDGYVRHGLRLAEGQRCGDHEARVYLERVNGMKRLFEHMPR